MVGYDSEDPSAYELNLLHKLNLREKNVLETETW